MATAAEIYRSSTLGTALTESLDEMITNGQMDPHIAMKVLKQFDATVMETLNSRVRSKCTMKGKLHTFRFVDEIWTFELLKPTIKFDFETVTAAGKVKLVSTTAKRGPDE
ncbi:transcription initiation factor IIA, gamma subunit [Gonapodya prolifera JEL478]|uniref:Transcription initiation factor IIA subunit 2 n=1 Tax=Gonapodya prolifera (strain JEL478) TaxID=1344416 RepID=A0A139AS60_GONPJ|nr:transcription initiation factor IIA, gamma subunit [Gonapodya prolifera JEL478]|eukprot:KXS19580.1 transcription initiation factor IIA, gamma subunit [Gonapodya prolifera JEL478]